MLVRIVKMTFRPDAIAAFEALFNDKKTFIRNFPGCLYLELWQDIQQPGVFFTYSHWTGEDALNAYRDSGLFKEVWQQTKPLFAAKAEAWSVHQKVQLS